MEVPTDWVGSIGLHFNVTDRLFNARLVEISHELVETPFKWGRCSSLLLEQRAARARGWYSLLIWVWPRLNLRYRLCKRATCESRDEAA